MMFSGRLIAPETLAAEVKSRPPVVLGYVLGEIMENAYVISIRAYDGYSWLLRPVTLLIFAGAVPLVTHWSSA